MNAVKPKRRRHERLAFLIAVALGCLWWPDCIFAQQNKENLPAFLSTRLNKLAADIAHGEGVALTQFWQEVTGHSPLIEQDSQDDRLCLVTFLWHGDSQSKWIGLVGGFRGQGQSGFQRFQETDLWYYTQRFPRDARFGYAVNDSGTGYGRDPLNPKWVGGLSIVELPGAPAEPWIRPIPGVAKGVLSHQSVHSSRLNVDRPVGVYTPAGFDPKKGSYDLLVVFDGEDYGDKSDSAVPTPVILDNLIGSLKIPPVVAILVDNLEDRGGDLLCSAKFEDFLANELVPWAESSYHTSDDPARITVAGASYGGLSAGCTAYRHPEVFGNVLSLSGTFSYFPGWNLDTTDFGVNTNWLAQRFSSTPRFPIRFFLSVGRFEGGPVWSVLRENRRLRDVLLARGYSVQYWEYSGNHDSLTWRDALADGLIDLLGPRRLDWLQ